MSGALTGRSQVTADVTGYYDRALVSRLEVSCFHIGYGEERTLPMNQGTKLTYAQYANLSEASTALTDGVTPAGSQSSRTERTITISWYGDYITYTDQLKEAGVDVNLLRIFRGILAYQAAKTLDSIIRDIIVAADQQIFSNGSTVAGINTVLEANDLKLASNQLERVGVPMITKRISPSTGVGTQAVDAGYIFIGHTDLRVDFENSSIFSNFIKVKDYARPGSAYPGEIGSVGNIRVILTPNGSVTAGGGTTGSVCRETSNNADVYKSVVFGEEFYTNLRLGQKSIRSIVKGFGSAGTEDALDQRASVGWKTPFAGDIQDESRGVCVISGASDIGTVV